MAQPIDLKAKAALYQLIADDSKYMYGNGQEFTKLNYRSNDFRKIKGNDLIYSQGLEFPRYKLFTIDNEGDIRIVKQSKAKSSDYIGEESYNMHDRSEHPSSSSNIYTNRNTLSDNRNTLSDNRFSNDRNRSSIRRIPNKDLIEILKDATFGYKETIDILEIMTAKLKNRGAYKNS